MNERIQRQPASQASCTISVDRYHGFFLSVSALLLLLLSTTRLISSSSLLLLLLFPSFHLLCDRVPYTRHLLRQHKVTLILDLILTP